MTMNSTKSYMAKHFPFLLTSSLNIVLSLICKIVWKLTFQEIVKLKYSTSIALLFSSQLYSIVNNAWTSFLFHNLDSHAFLRMSHRVSQGSNNEHRETSLCLLCYSSMSRYHIQYWFSELECMNWRVRKLWYCFDFQIWLTLPLMFLQNEHLLWSTAEKALESQNMLD